MPNDVVVSFGIHEDRFGGRWGAAECQGRDSSRHLLHSCAQQAPVGAGKYHGARYYSPALKRWMSADPVTVHEAGSDINPYSYGYGNPTRYVDPDGRNPIAVFVVAAIVNAAINAIVQHEATGHVNWGWNGVLGAAVGGGVMAVGGPVAAFAVPFTQTLLRGGSLLDALKAGTTSLAASSASAWVSAGITDSVVASGGAVTSGVRFGAGLAGTAIGTHVGMVTGAVLGDEPTLASFGTSMGTAFGAAIATTALSSAYQAATESTTAGEAAGQAAGRSARGASEAVARQNLELETAMLGAAIDSYNADNQLACGPAMQLCARLAQMAANSPAGQAAQRMAQRYGPVIANWAKVHGQQAAAMMARAVEQMMPAANNAVRFDPSRAAHIFRNAAGHVNPGTAQAQAYYARLFEGVASNPANLRADAAQAGIISADAAKAGVQAFTWAMRSGEQVWVTVRSGIIQNAGVNLPGAMR